MDARRPRSFARLRDRALSLLLLLAVWSVGAWLADSPQLLPLPGQVVSFLGQVVRNGELPTNIGITLARVLVAFVLAMLAGCVLGGLAGRSARIDAAIDPWLTIGLNLPVLVVIILAYIWLGLNDVAAVVAVAIAKTPTVVITIREGARAFDPQLDELAAVYRLPRLRRLRRIVVPQLAPYIAAAGRSGLSITWKLVLLVELLGRPNGVGFELNMLFQSFNVTGILAYGLSFAGLMLVVETVLLQPWERRANAWRQPA